MLVFVAKWDTESVGPENEAIWEAVVGQLSAGRSYAPQKRQGSFDPSTALRASNLGMTNWGSGRNYNRRDAPISESGQACVSASDGKRAGCPFPYKAQPIHCLTVWAGDCKSGAT